MSLTRNKNVAHLFKCMINGCCYQSRLIIVILNVILVIKIIFVIIHKMLVETNHKRHKTIKIIRFLHVLCKKISFYRIICQGLQCINRSIAVTYILFKFYQKFSRVLHSNKDGNAL